MANYLLFSILLEIKISNLICSNQQASLTYLSFVKKTLINVAYGVKDLV